MRIAIFTDVFLEVPGGIPSSINAQRKSLEKLGHEVTVFCPGYSTDDKNVIIVPTHKKMRFGGAPLSKSPEVVEQWVMENYAMFASFDLVHVHYEASCSIAGMRLARRFKIPLVQTMHGREDMAVAMNVSHPFKFVVAALLNYLHSKYIPHKKTVKVDKYLAPTMTRAKMWTLMVNHANFSDRVLTPSQHFADKLKHYGVTKPIEVVSNGVADEMVEEVDKKMKERSKTLVRTLKPGETLRIFWNSRLSNEKRIMPFLQALDKLKEPFFFSACGDGNAFLEAQNFVKKRHLEKRVKLYGRVPHEKVLDKMLEEHLSVTVSYGFDTQGLTLLEAEAVGMPVFFCDPDMKEVVPMDGAVIAKGPSPDEMAEALEDLIAHPERVEEMSKTMLKHREEILQSTQIKRLVEIYQGLVK